MPTADERLFDLLARTSRTFALAVPLLPEPARSTVCLAYLLFRVADTLEDAESWPREERLQALDDFAALVREDTPDLELAARVSSHWVLRAPTTHEGYLDLLRAVPELFEAVARLELPVQRIVFDHVLRTARGMRATVEQGDEKGRVRLGSIAELRAYCYVVAGIVGELLTAIFLHEAPQALEKVSATLRLHQAAFGEGLQLVNILKDSAQDEGAGRVYLPAGVPREQIFELARSDLRRAQLYVAALASAGAPQGFVAFTSLPTELAVATLPRLERDGAGAKVPRGEVLEMLARWQS